MILYSDYKKDYVAPEVCIERFSLNLVMTISSQDPHEGEIDAFGEPDAVVHDSAGNTYYLNSEGEMIDPNEVDSVF